MAGVHKWIGKETFDMKIHNALLSKGYFPKELPPVFTTLDFGREADKIVKDWQKAGVFKRDVKSLGKLPGKKKRSGAFTYNLKAAEAEVFSKPKRGYERRDVHIVHPLPQALLSMEVGANWRSIQKWLSRQTFSEDEIRISSEYERSIKGINFPLHNIKKRYLEATSDWVVTTDITRFYPSIYTHSIAWAVYGKERVKHQLSNYKGSLADRIDLLVRSCNRNQTVGIPVGPETSRLIAEIISSRIDQEYLHSNVVASAEAIDRLQDDWTIGVGSLEEAERVLSTISGLYRSYGLDINGSKTSIDRIVVERQSAWISEMGAFLSHRSGRLVGMRLREFLDLALTLQSQNPSAQVVSYALSVVDNMRIDHGDVPTVESFLIRSAVVAPISLDRICRVILDLQNRTGALSAKRIGGRFIRLAEVAIEKGHTYEVIWLLYTLRGLKRPVDAKAVCRAAGGMPSAAIALVLMDMKSKGLGLGKLPIADWQSQITEDSANTDWTWLMAYEGIRNGWLLDTHGLMTKPLFEPLIRRNIAFYDPRRNIPTSASAAEKRVEIRRRNMFEIKDMLKGLRGIELDELDEY